jgi:hypothetical protein
MARFGATEPILCQAAGFSICGIQSAHGPVGLEEVACRDDFCSPQQLLLSLFDNYRCGRNIAEFAAPPSKEISRPSASHLWLARALDRLHEGTLNLQQRLVMLLQREGGSLHAAHAVCDRDAIELQIGLHDRAEVQPGR